MMTEANHSMTASIPQELAQIMEAVGEQKVQYELEKISGKRNASGATKLVKLKEKHKTIVNLHIRGFSGRQISAAMGVSRTQVSTILHDPLCQDVIKKAHQEVEEEFSALYGRVVDTIRDGLDKEMGMDCRLKSVDRYAKMKQVNGDQGKGPETAEDVVERILQLNIHVNAGS